MATANTFETILSGLEYTPTTDEATGFLGPLVRGVGHLVTLITLLSEDEASGKRPTLTEIKTELADAGNHFKRMPVDRALFSTASVEYLEGLEKLFAKGITDSAKWSNEDAIRNVRDMVNRWMQFLTRLDREVLGIRTSDPGYHL